MLILAVSTQRTIGLAIALFVAVGFAIYVLFNMFSGRAEIGAEIELAPNRKPYLADEELETRKLDLSLAAGVATLAIVALALPLYWLGEPGRQEGYVNLTNRQFADRGGEAFEELCAQCHGENAVGGTAAFTVLDDDGRFVSSVNWTAPALNTIMYRFTEQEVRHVLEFGRPQSPMPAWGLPGGGPLTEQQLDHLLAYLVRIQLPAEQVSDEIQAGLRTSVRAEVEAQNPEPFAALASMSADASATAEDLAVAQGAVDDVLDDFIADLAASNQAAYGNILFNNPAAGGSYGCARCHTEGASFDADGVIAANPAVLGLINAETPGGGGFGPSLVGVESQFDSAEIQAEFIARGCSTNLQYGNSGVCEPSGQMPGFGFDSTDHSGVNGGLLTNDQIAAIVAYERSLQ